MKSQLETPMTVVSDAPATGADIGTLCRDLIQMTKPTIGMLVVITAIPSMIMAAGQLPDPITGLATFFGTFLASSSSGVFNHLVDNTIDAAMRRTRGRPLPKGRVSQKTAILFATLLGILSFTILWRFTTPLAAWTSLAANFFYVVIYTMYLKPRTTQNIVIGGAAGAVGPLLGWAAISGSFSLEAWILFAIIFLWTPPHFWALAIKYRDDYRNAGVPMMPSVRGVKVTSDQMFYYTLSLIPAVVSLYLLGSVGLVYLVPSLLLTLYFCWLAYRLKQTQEVERAMPLFVFSCVYLFGIFGFLGLDRMISLI